MWATPCVLCCGKTAFREANPLGKALGSCPGAHDLALTKAGGGPRHLDLMTLREVLYLSLMVEINQLQRKREVGLPLPSFPLQQLHSRDILMSGLLCALCPRMHSYSSFKAPKLMPLFFLKPRFAIYPGPRGLVKGNGAPFATLRSHG